MCAADKHIYSGEGCSNDEYAAVMDTFSEKKAQAQLCNKPTYVFIHQALGFRTWHDRNVK